MTVQDLILERKTLEAKIQSAVGGLVSEFESRVGVGVSDVSLNMIEVTKFDESTRSHVLGEVRVQLAIE